MSTTEEPVRGRPPKTRGAPHGRNQVRPAVIEAATELFAAQGINGVSIRQIARQAGVNPALVPRYLGTKDDLIDAVLNELLDQIIARLDQYLDTRGSVFPPLPPVAMDRYFRIVAHLVVEGGDLEAHRPEFPVIRRVIASIAARPGVSAAEARRRGAQIFVLEVGARLFETPLLHAAGLGPDDAADLQELVHRLSSAIGNGETA